jgi:leucyl-tRNA synthetase
MSNAGSIWRLGPLGLLSAVLVLVAAVLFIGIRYRDVTVGMDVVPKVMAGKTAVISALRINMIKSVGSEKSAVMAETDEASIAFSEEAVREIKDAEQDLQELRKLIEAYPAEKEVQLLQEFQACWTEFRAIDQAVLEFAVQNSNLKAARLSFGAAREAMNHFEAALSKLARDQESEPICGIVSKALSAGLKILALHAPHIAAPNDADMDNLEKTIQENDTLVHQSLNALKPLVPPDRQADLRQAEAAYKEFASVTAKVIELSRQNTNIKSFELSLNRKRKITAHCDEILTSLQDAVQSRSFKATR